MGNYEKLPCFNSTSVRLNAVGYTYSRHEPQFQFYISTIKYSQAIFGLMIDKFQFYISTIKCSNISLIIVTISCFNSTSVRLNATFVGRNRFVSIVSILHQYD